MQPLLLLSTGWIQFLEVFAALSILILLHEFGHFFFARLFKVRVEKFYLFFDFLFPFPNIGNFSLLKKKMGDTVYGLGWFPLGGYVKIAGMVDESMDKEAMAQPPQPDEFRAKPAWQRLFIMLGGIIVNVLVAAIAYVSIFGIWGETYLPTQAAKYGIDADSAAMKIGLRSGDRIVGFNGKPVERFNRIVPKMILSDAKTMDVERDGRQISLAIPKGTVRGIIKGQGKSFIAPRIPFVVDTVLPGTPAAGMGLMKGDSIVSANDIPTPFFDQFRTVVRANKGLPVRLVAVRKDGTQHTAVATVAKDGTLGIAPNRELGRFFDTVHKTYGVGAAMSRAVQYTGEQFNDYAAQLRLLFTSSEIKVSESLGGLYTFGKSAPETFEWESFLRYLAFISIILAFMNLLPIPGLDGGYVFFLLFEMISGRKVSEKVMERATTVGLVLLLGLMLYANGLDIFRAFRK